MVEGLKVSKTIHRLHSSRSTLSANSTKGDERTPQVFNSAEIERIPDYSVSKGFRNTFLSILPLIAAFATETQLAAYGIKDKSLTAVSSSNPLDSAIGLARTWMPFTNEVFGVFNIWNKFIDLIAATAILWNTVDECEEYGAFSGFLKGVGLLIFSFFGPEWFIPRFQNFVAGIFKQHDLFTSPIDKKAILGVSKLGRIATGFMSVYILECCMKLWDVYGIPLFEEGVAWLKAKYMPPKAPPVQPEKPVAPISTFNEVLENLKQ